MALEHLLTAMERDAIAQAEAQLAEARAAAAALTGEAEARLERRCRDALDAREATLRASAETALGEARRAGRQRVLDARQRLVERVFAAARALFLSAVETGPYRAALPAHLAEALRAIGDAPAVIRCPETLVPWIRAAVARRKHLAVRGDPTVGPGFRVATTDGAIEVDATLEGRLERLQPVLALAVLGRLGAGAPA